MVVAGVSYNGKLKIRKVERNVKINSEYYQQRILTPIFEEEIPELYGNSVNKVYFHQDKASSHTSISTVNYMNYLSGKTGINVIPFNHIPVKSPDASPWIFVFLGYSNI